ncbi:MAG: UvrD-helicase domain-containing protein [Pseudomonadota bacterium]
MKFIADLHIHSKYSRATAKNLDLENLYVSARRKGITVVGTGDFTHPQWFSELKEKLIPAEPGLFQLKKEIAGVCDREVPESCKSQVRFILESEISNIYKKNGKTRKNHNLVFFPDFEKAEIFNSKLDRIGNIKSDGRPILGLDSRNLLEIILETSENAYLVPAHIWTPWFSLLGSKSGFDSIEECFEDLSPYIFAAETGLSSDPPMNWRISSLDRITLISNSDAHSPGKLGRESNLFNTDLDYFAIRKAMETGNPDQFLGTFEFYPEEGKYHLDGHRKCNIRFTPEESRKHKGICPKCGKPITLGVLYRVEELADRKEGYIPSNHHPYYSIVPLQEILSELLKVGPQSQKVKNYYDVLIQTFGSELDILHTMDPVRIEAAGIPYLGEAIQRIRDRKIVLFPGYDGEFGKIQIFDERERQKQQAQKNLFELPESPEKEMGIINKERISSGPSERLERKTRTSFQQISRINDLNEQQRSAVSHMGTPLLIVAGPGTGKTLTLTHKIAYLIHKKEISPDHILAVTFTNKAAQEMKERLKRLLGEDAPLPFVATFHSLCFHILNEVNYGRQYTIADEDDRIFFIKEACARVREAGIKLPHSEKNFLHMIIAAKQIIMEPFEDITSIADDYDCRVDLLRKVYGEYQNILSGQGVYDFEDLIFKVVKLLETDDKICKKYRSLYTHILIDEYQDLNQGQYRIVKALASENPNLFAIGDPDQSIYGFRGSDVQFFKMFINDYPQAKTIHLTRNYRSTETILQASFQIIRSQHDQPSESRVYSEIDGTKTISVMKFSSEKAEAVAIGKIIEQMVGGLGFYSIDFQKAGDSFETIDRSFSDFAILYRTNTQGNLLGDVLGRAGIPFQQASRDQAFSQKGIREVLSLFKIVSGVGTHADFQQVMETIGKGFNQKDGKIFKKWCFRKNFRLEESLNRVLRFPVPGMGTTNQLQLSHWINKLFEYRQAFKNRQIDENLFDLREQFLKTSGNIQQEKETDEAFSLLLKTARLYQNNVDGFFEMVSLCVDVDACDFQSEKVTLMTMHAAKGLEFPVVFIAGCEEGFVPYQKKEEKINIDEEKRLFYVAMTRAKEHLFLTHAVKRKIFGKSIERKPSPFVYEIEDRLRYHENTEPKKSKTGKHSNQIQLELFR